MSQLTKSYMCTLIKIVSDAKCDQLDQIGIKQLHQIGGKLDQI